MILLLFLGLAGSTGCSEQALAQSGKLARAPHGAIAMDAQAARVAELLGNVDITQPPARVDAEIWAASIPKGNEMTAERVALGRKLYFDVRLSADKSVACATCHDVFRGFTDRRPVSEGIGDKLGRRNAPTTLNSAFLEVLFLDGRAPSLEAQAKLPIINPIEMGMATGADAAKAIAGDPEYGKMFQAAYGRPPNYDDIGRALAAFERTLIFLDAPFDRYVHGDETAISEEAKMGWVLFNGKARCVSCHPINTANPVGTDNMFHNIGVSARKQNFEKLAAEGLKLLGKDPTMQKLDDLALGTDKSELGRFIVTQNRADIGGFRTSQLRNTGITAPYMHDGSLQTLWDVMDHYNKGGEPNSYLDGGIEPLALTEAEINQLVAFMFALTDTRFNDQNQDEMKRQQEAAKKTRPFRDEDLAFRRTMAFEPKK